MYSNNISSEHLTDCLVGTAGWHYKDWEIVFYPEKSRGKFDKLRFYSQFFDCVEVDSTFYSFYTPEVAKSWIERVKENKKFLFSLKLNNAFTHKDNFSRNEIKTMTAFIDELASNNKLESILLQFPYHFFNTKENRDKLLKLSRTFGNYRLVTELRHISWHSPLTYNFLEESKLHLCTIDQPMVLDNIGLTTSVLGRYAYLRLHGRNSQAWLRNSNEGKFDYLYSNFELTEIFRKIEELRKRSDRVYIILNNHPIGKAVVNSFSLLSLIKKRPVMIPEQTVYYYSHLRPIAHKVNTNQLPIFS